MHGTNRSFKEDSSLLGYDAVYPGRNFRIFRGILHRQDNIYICNVNAHRSPTYRMRSVAVFICCVFICCCLHMLVSSYAAVFICCCLHMLLSSYAAVFICCCLHMLVYSYAAVFICCCQHMLLVLGGSRSLFGPYLHPHKSSSHPQTLYL
jgi:hypothetical protein